jgi:NAD(P)-dependent dehydrogenase (short-subunit alcohol dehydrogenase family)
VPLRLTVLAAKAFWRHRDRENAALKRNVVNVSSTSGLNIYPNQQQAVYSATKAALNYLTCHLALELQPLGVRVNATAPNAFGQRLSLERVCHSIVMLDEGDMTGKVYVLDQDGEGFTD